MAATLKKVPDFLPTQQVSFVDGEGIVQNFKFESGTWIYLVEMMLGVEPCTKTEAIHLRVTHGSNLKKGA